MTEKEIRKIYDAAFAQQTAIGAIASGFTNGVPTPQNIGVTNPPPMPATATEIMQQMQYASGKNFTATELNKLFENMKPYASPNHMETLEKKEGFLWLDEEKTWGLVPFGSKPKLNSADMKKRPEIPGKFALMHRHDDDMMFEETALNARYHGDNYYICSHCHKPCPKEFVTLFVLQSTLSDGKPKT